MSKLNTTTDDISDFCSCSLISKTLDFFEIANLVSSKLRASDFDIFSFLKILSMQLVYTQAKSLKNTDEFINKIIEHNCVQIPSSFNKDFNNDFISSVLSDISSYDEKKLILDFSSHILKRLNVDVESIYIDFALCDLGDDFLKIRDSKYNATQPPTFCQIQLVETTSNIPIFTKVVDVNIKNRDLAFSLIIEDLALVSQYFPKLKYLIADSSMLNRDTLSKIKNLNIFLISKLKTPCKRRASGDGEVIHYRKSSLFDSVEFRHLDDMRLNGGFLRVISFIDERRKNQLQAQYMQTIDKARRQFRHHCDKVYLNKTFNIKDKNKIMDEMPLDLSKKSLYLKLDKVDLKEDKDSFVVLGYKTSINRRKLNRDIDSVETQFDVVTTDFDDNNLEKVATLFLCKGYTYRIWFVKNIRKLGVDNIYIKDRNSLNSFMALLTINYIIFNTINNLLKELKDKLIDEVGTVTFEKSYEKLLGFDEFTSYLDGKIANRNVKKEMIDKIFCLYEDNLKNR